MFEACVYAKHVLHSGAGKVAIVNEEDKKLNLINVMKGVPTL